MYRPRYITFVTHTVLQGPGIYLAQVDSNRYATVDPTSHLFDPLCFLLVVGDEIASLDGLQVFWMCVVEADHEGAVGIQLLPFILKLDHVLCSLHSSRFVVRLVHRGPTPDFRFTVVWMYLGDEDIVHITDGGKNVSENRKGKGGF